MNNIRIFNPDFDEQVSADWELPKFFRDWYLDAKRNQPGRKPVSESTLERRADAIRWWEKLMDPIALRDIASETLAEFKLRLDAKGFYRRSKLGKLYKLAEATRKRYVDEVLIVLRAAGRGGGSVRANVLDVTPEVYVEPVPTFPKPTWSIDEARQIARILSDLRWEREQPLDILAKATIATWFYTGHRARVIEDILWKNIVEHRPGEWFLHIDKSRKTGKPDRLAIHPRLLELLQACRGLDPVRVIAWPVDYAWVRSLFERWQVKAGLPPHRVFTPQAFRRLHAELLAASGFEAARKMASGALGHSSYGVTEASYTNPRDWALLTLPDLWEVA